MTTPLVCLVIVAVLPWVLAGVGGYLRIQQLGELDNKHPRQQAQQLTGAAARAVAAQGNAWEALGVFTVAVLTAHLAGADASSSANAALVFLVVRLLHPVFYIANLDMLRSGVFVVGIGSVGYLFYLALSAA